MDVMGSGLERVTRIGLLLHEFNLTRKLCGLEQAQPLFNDAYRIAFNHGQESAKNGIVEHPNYLLIFSSLKNAWSAGYSSVKDQVYSIPTLIVLNGLVFQNLYDHDPFMGTYSLDSKMTLEIKPSDRDKAKEIALKFYEEYKETHDFVDGTFVSESIVILDQFNQAINFYDGNEWDYGGQYIEYDDLYKSDRIVIVLENEALQEAGWDNHDTARSLRKKSYLLKTKIEISRAHYKGM